MRESWGLPVVLLVVALGSYGAAQSGTPAKTEPLARTETPAKTEITFERVLSTSITHLQRILLPLAMAMPEDKYGFAPTSGEFKGVHTFGEQLKHIAASNFTYASAILGEKPPADVGEEDEGPASLKTKAEILKYLNDSFSYAQKAIATVDAKNVISPIKSPFGEGEATRLAMVHLIIGHCFDHYGQLVEYVRMNGIVPPASQR
jgi:uncharacterized damage-inducible protein DinB